MFLEKYQKYVASFFLVTLFIFLNQSVSFSNTENVKAELILEASAIKPGGSFWVAVRMKMAPQWHTYWKNPGDVGLRTKINWQLPAGFEAGPVQWPYPQKINANFSVSYGYENEILLLTQIKTSADIPNNTTQTIKADVQWLECKEVCIPGNSKLETRILTTETENPKKEEQQAFDKARNKLPLSSKFWNIKASHSKKEIHIEISSNEQTSPKLKEIYFFPYRSDLILHQKPQTLKKLPNGYELTIQRSTITTEMPLKLQGVLYSKTGWAPDTSRKSIEVNTLAA